MANGRYQVDDGKIYDMLGGNPYAGLHCIIQQGPPPNLQTVFQFACSQFPDHVKNTPAWEFKKYILKQTTVMVDGRVERYELRTFLSKHGPTLYILIGNGSFIAFIMP